jgi:hypothetical protein
MSALEDSLPTLLQNLAGIISSAQKLGLDKDPMYAKKLGQLEADRVDISAALDRLPRARQTNDKAFFVHVAELVIRVELHLSDW